MAASLRIPRARDFTPRGFTLLEVMLALLIGTTVLLALSMAIHLQLKFTDAGRTDVEEAQLARAILRQVADDLRASVLPQAIEVEGAAEAFKAAAEAAKKAASAAGAAQGQQAGGSAGGVQGSPAGGGQGSGQGAATGQAAGGGSTGSQTGGGAAAGGAAAGGAAGGGLGGSSGGAAGGASGSSGAGLAGAGGTTGSTTTDSTSTTLVTGLYGTAYSLQFDLARVPRVDEWTAMPAGAAAGLAAISQPGLDRTSEVKTVAYMLLTGSPLAGGASLAPTGLAPSATGLVRTEMDRATAAYMRTGATLSVSTGKQELLAPEVTSLMFRYTDGTSWYTSWDSTQMQGIPTAVEIQLGIRSSKERTGTPEQALAPAVAGAPAPAANSLTYRMVVQIPVARSGTVTMLQAQDDEAEASASESSSTLGGGIGGASGSTLGSGT